MLARYAANTSEQSQTWVRSETLSTHCTHCTHAISSSKVYNSYSK